MIATPSSRPSLSIVPRSGNIPCQASMAPAAASLESHLRDSRFTRLGFRDVTGLSCRAVDRFVELGFIKPFGVQVNERKEFYYSARDARKVRVMMALLEGKLNLRQAHDKAEAILSGKEPKVGKKVKGGLDLAPLERFIDRPYAMPSDWKNPYDFGDDSGQDTATPKPRRVNVTLTHADGTLESRELSGGGVPNERDWEERADNLWSNAKWHEHGPVVSIRMEDESGRQYLRELSYDCTTETLKPSSAQASRRKC